MTAPPIPILVYHSVDTACAPAYRRWMVTPERFARQMGYLSDNGYSPVSTSALASALIANAPLPPKVVTITFDDGLRDFWSGALPILQRFGFAATLFVVTGHVGATSRWLQAVGEGDRAMLGWGELRELGELGIECGAHTSTHPQLDVIARSAAESEIIDSKSALEDGLGRPVSSFAYPHGYATPALRQMVRRAGFASACRVRHALSSRQEDLYALSRIVVTNDLTDERFGQLLAGRQLLVAPPPDRLASHGWRLVRRLDHWVRSFNRSSSIPR